MLKRPVPQYDFKAFGEAIKTAHVGRKESCKKVSDEMFISSRCLANRDKWKIMILSHS